MLPSGGNNSSGLMSYDLYFCTIIGPYVLSIDSQVQAGKSYWS
jgi:hypothetical protein